MICMMSNVYLIIPVVSWELPLSVKKGFCNTPAQCNFLFKFAYSKINIGIKNPGSGYQIECSVYRALAFNVTF